MGSRIQQTMLAISVVFLAACGTTPNVGDSVDREVLRSQSKAALADFKTADPTLDRLLATSNAYVVFPRIIEGAVGVGGAHGNGEVYQGGKFIGYADVSQATIGLQLGGQKFGELILFRNEGTFADFTHSTYEMDARASAIAASKGAASTADYSKGVLVFTLPESGVMAQAALGVQKFRYTPAK